MTLIDDYLELQEKYEKKYGEKTIVLMEVGSFFELYGTKTRGRIQEVADITNLNISKKGDIDVSEKNPYMAGFPNHSFEKWKEILLKHDYTIIKIEQDGHGTKDPKRTVSEIISPGVNLEANSFTNCMMSIYLEEMRCHKTQKQILCLGLSVVDITTGETTVYETHSKPDDFKYALDEIYRFLQMFSPQEILIHTENVSMDHDELLAYLECPNLNIRYNIYSEQQFMLQNKFKLEILKKVYSNTGTLTPTEYIDMDKMLFALNSYIYLIQFTYEHNEQVIEKLNRPKIWEHRDFLILSHDSIVQLNIIPDRSRQQVKGISCLWDILDKTSTSMGRRFLRDNLLNPILDIVELEKRYSLVHELQQGHNSVSIYKHIRDVIKNCCDIERLHRKMAIKMLNPSSFLGLDMSYMAILKSVELVKSMGIEPLLSILPGEDVLVNFKKFIDEYSNILLLDKLHGINLNSINQSIFVKGHYENIDKCMENIEGCQKRLQSIANAFSEMIDKGKGPCVDIKENERDGHYLTTTNTRATILKKTLAGKTKVKITISGFEDLEIKCSDIDLKGLTGITKITTPEVRNISHSLVSYQAKMHNMAIKQFQELVSEFYGKYASTLKNICHYVSYIDFLCCIAQVSLENGYTRPTIVENSSSYLKASALRHPIIEKINNQIQYVANDMSLGHCLDSHSEQQGVLLFGLNCVGKSTMMKSVGLAIVMAQCGFYVAAKQFIYSPYKYLFTRISSNDNIFKGQSTFAVEMSELRSILKRANKNSLVLGDELCSGTETTSALAIVTAGVKRLVEKEASFIFTTHLHKLTDIEEIREEKAVKAYHMETLYNDQSKKLIYNRKLQPGSGSAIYGLEVARAMDLDEEFIKSANQIRKRILGQTETIVVNKTSQFNKKLIISKCSICGSSTEEVHHINEQHLANNQGMIGQFHKNNLWNLVQLCHNCHQEVHHNRVNILGYVQTSDGVELQYDRVIHIENMIVSKKKYSISDMEKIQNKYNICKSYSKTKKLLFLEDNITISVDTIKKIIENKY